MADFDDTNSGVLFKNDKMTSERSPNYRGHSVVACPHCSATSKHWISAWIKTAKGTGAKFMSMAFTADDASTNKNTYDNAGDEFDDDIPF